MRPLLKLSGAQYNYRVFGLDVRADLPLPGLMGNDGGTCDVAVIEESPSSSPPWGGVDLVETSPPRIRVGFAPSVGLDISPSHIRYYRWNCPDVRVVGHLVTDWALPLVLLARGTPAFHGAAVRLQSGGACLICGLSGAGKSTVSLELSRRGYPKLADDIAALRTGDASVVVEPGVGHSKLLVDALERMSLPQEGLEPVTHKAHKFIVPTGVWPTAEPVRCIFELSVYPGDQVDIQPVTGPEKFSILDRHTVGTTLMRRGGLRGMHLAWLQRVATIPVYRLRRPAGVDSMDQLIHCMEQVWAHGGPVVSQP